VDDFLKEIRLHPNVTHKGSAPSRPGQPGPISLIFARMRRTEAREDSLNPTSDKAQVRGWGKEADELQIPSPTFRVRCCVLGGT